MTSVIVSPAEIFKRFAEAYSTIEPLVAISYDAKTAIPLIVEDICHGREVAAFRNGPNPLSKKTERLEGQLCSKHFLSFLRIVRSMMKEQGVFHVTPTRAAELLYNFDFLDESFEQPFVRLKMVKHTYAYLASTAEYERRFGARFRLTLGEANDAMDWTMSPNGWNDLRPSKRKR